MALAVVSAQDGYGNTLIVTITRNLSTVGKSTMLKTGAPFSRSNLRCQPKACLKTIHAFLYYSFATNDKKLTCCVGTSRAGGSWMSGLLIASEGCQWGLYDCYWCSGLKAVYYSCGPGIPSSCFVFAQPISERDNIWCKRTMRLRSHPLSECLSLKRRGLEQACWETGEGIAYGPSYSDTAEWLSLLLTHSHLLSNSLTRTLYLFLSLNAHTHFTETHTAWLNRITGRFERCMERWWRIAKIRLKCYLVLRMREDMEFLTEPNARCGI